MNPSRIHDSTYNQLSAPTISLANCLSLRSLPICLSLGTCPSFLFPASESFLSTCSFENQN